MSYQVTGVKSQYVNKVRIAAEVLIRGLAQMKNELTLDELCQYLGCEDQAERNSVLYAVRDAKADGIISKTDEKCVYKVLAKAAA